MTPRLQTPRLVLRRFAPGDWTVVDAMLSDSEATRHMHFAAWTADRRREWFDWCVANAEEPDADAINWAIARKDTDGVLGWFGIGTSDDGDVLGARSFGYLLDRGSWGRGYMTEALRAVLALEFGERGAPRLRATCDVGNPASARVMEKVGMRRERTAYDADFEGNRAFRHHYAIERATYLARR